MPAWLIVTIAVLFLAGSVLTAMPTTHEKRRKSLMKEAYREGFRVERFRGVAADHRFTQTGDWYLYWRPWTAEQVMQQRHSRQPRLVWSSADSGGDHSLEIPQPFEALYMDSRGVGLVWQEKGAPEAVRAGLRQFNERLKAWRG